MVSFAIYIEIILLYLRYFCEVCAQDQSKQNISVGVLEEFNNPSKDADELRSRSLGRIEASIIPVINPNGSRQENHHSSRIHSKAEIRVLVPPVLKDHNPHANGLIRASSILMEYDEDTRKYIYPNARSDNHEPHRIRHNSHKHLAPIPLSDDYFAANDAPLEEVDSPAKPSPKPKDSNDDQKTNAPVRRPIIVEDFSNIEIKDNFSGVLLSESPFSTASKRQHPSDRSRGLLPKRTSNGFILRPRQQSRWIALHTPTRIYIPVRYDGKDSSENVTDANCVQCSPNISVTAPRRETQVEVPVPAVSVCYRIKRNRGPKIFSSTDF
ncbi:uncharacterized protein TNCT_253271 [Trichonephila clavata]|uniref:Uncharacterized protein n=1 Tax=Trichonephila clavata TaxID=2740835 RepID=A0A8X6FG36_TRICU|nr:uncharacterized protein TNCT_253271 [Trichonephila clavata]